MHKTYGKLVDRLLMKTGKSWVRMSTYTHSGLTYMTSMSAKPQLSPTFIPTFCTYISPACFAVSPLIEYIFYPVSTGPITNNTKEKIKER